MSASTAEDAVRDAQAQLLGTVVAVQANFYQVRLDRELTAGATSQLLSEFSVASPSLLCTRRSRLKKIGQQVMVGDRVVVEEPDWAGGRGAIAQVLPRQTELLRPPIANANQILLVFALAEPDLDPIALSRFLVKAESTDLVVSLCLNKSDLVAPQQLQEWRDRLDRWGYQPLFISVHTGMGLGCDRELSRLSSLEGTAEAQRAQREEAENGLGGLGRVWCSEDQSQCEQAESLVRPANLYSQLLGKITVICGPSGVGKSSLINYLIPSLNLRVGAVSGKLGRGRHTTRHVELFALPLGGVLADTPGFNQPELDCTPDELVDYFPEARQRLAGARCQFSDCLHRDEPNCVVRGSWERYPHYLELLEGAIARRSALQQLGDVESSLKLKSKSAGKQEYEPKLETKKYRRSSRRSQHQNLQEDRDRQ